MILRPTIIVALLTLGVVLMIPPKYQSEARVLVIGRDNVYLRPDADKDVIDRGVVDQEAVTSQAQLILSRDLASEVIAKLKLNELPEFDPALGNISVTKRVLGFLGVIRNPLAMTPEERVLEAYYDRLTVFPVEKSRVIVIDFLSENPELAARVANAIADSYLKRQQEAKQDQAPSAGQWLSGEIESLRKKVAEQAESEGRGVPRALEPSGRPEQHDSFGAAARRSQYAACYRARTESRRGSQSQAHPRHAQVRRADRILRCAQFRVDPPAVRAARHLACAACRAVLLASRQPSPHRELQRRSAISTSMIRKEAEILRARLRVNSSLPTRASRATRHLQPAQECTGRDLERGIRCAASRRSSATPNRSAICWSPISLNIATPARAAQSIPPRPTRGSFRAPPPRAYRLIRRNSRPSQSRRSRPSCSCAGWS